MKNFEFVEVRLELYYWNTFQKYEKFFGFHDFRTVGIFSWFSENPRDFWFFFVCILDFFCLEICIPGTFIPGIRDFLSLGIFIPGIQDFF